MLWFVSFVGTQKGGLKSRGYFKGPSECLASLYKHDGLKACYRGTLATAWRDIPGYGIYMAVYERLFYDIMRTKYADRQGILASLLAGGSAGLVSWATVIPLDVIKSNVQADVLQGKEAGYMKCIGDLWRKGGVRVFYTGLVINSIRAFPASAVTFLMYSQILRILNEPTSILPDSPVKEL